MYNRNPKEMKKQGMGPIDTNLSFRKIMNDVENFGNHFGNLSFDAYNCLSYIIRKDSDIEKFSTPRDDASLYSYYRILIFEGICYILVLEELMTEIRRSRSRSEEKLEEAKKVKDNRKETKRIKERRNKAVGGKASNRGRCVNKFFETSLVIKGAYFKRCLKPCKHHDIERLILVMAFMKMSKIWNDISTVASL
ncbi:predicted protein [Arabidopsis lyrata subsp. lyrata]|uniref:Predicted protein n=1 Tax=Arabidopsis lyrata subsp. lyrata TaxID=81972 RepID=D7L8N4_ARALL|nr:predicted protein [Arabidopsis lyrata subsp. lyrata]